MDVPFASSSKWMAPSPFGFASMSICILSKKRLPYFIAHSFCLVVPGAIAMRADSMRFEEVRKFFELN